jgi:dsRNA-specific ribonuclease
MAGRIDLRYAERVIGREFEDPELGALALKPWKKGFSRLEFLGDSILGLAVFTSSEVHGTARGTAIYLVSNDHLDEVFRQRLAKSSDTPTGDIIEALVGASFLDADFDAAAHVGVRLCAPEVPLRIPPLSLQLRQSVTPHGLKFIGAELLMAVVAARLCREFPGKSHRWLSNRRSEILSLENRADVGRSLGAELEDGLSWNEVQRIEVETLDVLAAREFLKFGWSHAVGLLGQLLLD